MRSCRLPNPDGWVPPSTVVYILPTIRSSRPLRILHADADQTPRPARWSRPPPIGMILTRTLGQRSGVRPRQQRGKWREMSNRRSSKTRHARVAPPPNYLSRRVQQRLLTLVGMLLLVLVLMNFARRPDNWTWLWRMAGQQPPALSVDPQAADHVRSRLVATADRSGLAPGIDESKLDDIRDDSYFRPAEQTAWFELWRTLRDASEDELRSSSLGEVSYLQIYRQTSAYRGRLVDLTGIIRRANWVDAPENGRGIRRYLQCWLFPQVAPFEPIVVYVLDPPTTLPLGMTVSAPVRLTGIVYKRWSYQSADGLAVAPVILAKVVTRIDTAPEIPASPATVPTPYRAWLAVGTTALVSLAFVALLFRLTARRFHHPRQTEPLPEIIGPVGDQVVTAPAEASSISGPSSRLADDQYRRSDQA